jgi:hypothetical protein
LGHRVYHFDAAVYTADLGVDRPDDAAHLARLGQKSSRSCPRGTRRSARALSFFIIALPSIGGYLLGSGVLFALVYVTWPQHYQNVLNEPPAGYRPTGERYVNPGSPDPVSVWHDGITRVYVRDRPVASHP